MVRPRSGPLAALLSPDPSDVVPRLAPLLLIPTAAGPLAVALGLGYAVFVLVPALYRSPWVWFGLAAVHLVPLLREWHGVDNHEWLIGYLLLALGTSFLTSDPRRALAVQGAALIALTFGLAVVWKVISGEYLDGDFFHHALLADPRFAPAAELLGLSTADADANARLVASLRSGGPGGELRTTGVVRGGALVMTWWGVLLEAAIAVAYLWPDRGRARAAGAALLVVFVVTTYVVVPVVTFGLALALMAYASLPKGRRVRASWVAAIVFLVVWSPIWRALTDVTA